MSGAIHIALASDARYFPGLLVTATSVAASTEPDVELVFHVLDNGIPDEDFDWLIRCVRQYGWRCEFDRIPFAPDAFRHGRPLLGSHMPYARILLPEILDVSRVVYLDSDLLFFKNIRALWAMPHDGAGVLAVQDQIHWLLKSDCPWIAAGDPAGEKPYFNSGVMVMDLDRWRVTDVAGRARDLIACHPESCAYADQTVLNYLLAGDVRFIDLSWNRRPDKVCVDAYDGWMDVNLHYLAIKPWLTYVNADNCAFWYRFHDVMCRKRWPAVLAYGLLAGCLKRSAMARLAGHGWSRRLVNRVARWGGVSWDAALHNGGLERSAGFRRVVQGWRDVRSQRLPGGVKA